MLENLKVVNGS